MRYVDARDEKRPAHVEKKWVSISETNNILLVPDAIDWCNNNGSNCLVTR